MKRHSMMIVALLCSLAAASAQADEVYKYVDKSGKTHFSDQPQPGWNKVNITPLKPVGGTGETTAEQEQRAAACTKRSADLASYETATTITEKNGLGAIREYTAEERKQLIDATAKEVDALCSPQPSAG